jgi:hypothetical protein
MTWETTAAASVLTGTRPPVSLRGAAAKAAPSHVLLIAAGQVPDEAAAGRWIQQASPDTVRLWIVPRSVHTGGLATQPLAWASQVTGFLDSARLPGHRHASHLLATTGPRAALCPAACWSPGGLPASSPSDR